MGLPRKAPKTSGLLVAAIRKLKNIHGSTSKEITNYIASECDSPTKTIQRQMKLALRRGLSTGVLHRSKDGYYTCAPLDDVESPGDRSRRRKCGRKRRSRRRSRRSCKRRGRRSGKRRSRSRRRRRMRRGKKCGKKRRSRSRSRKCRRRRRRCGRRRDDGAEMDELADRIVKNKQPAKRTRAGRTRSKNDSKDSSQTRVSSATSGGTIESGANTASTHSASGKESLSDHSDISGASDETAGETKP